MQKALEADAADLVQAIGLLVRRLRVLGGQDGLSWTEGIVLQRLEKQGPASSAELARELGVRPQSMGTTVARLAAQGLVERKAHATDGRQLNIALSPKGAALRKGARDARRGWLAQRAAKLQPKDQATLFAAGAIMKRLAQS
jgi:DNA-binding MarR family transcriptional regulator